jgi:Na+/H+ antiporter NhaD/arsenite permease-like protein
MMTLVALLEPTGFFQYLAIRVARISKGNPVRLLILLGGVTTLASMFLDNVTTVILIAPVTILITEILGLSLYPFLIAEALLSNTGGVATLVGDPPNVIIASAANLSFDDFIYRSLPIVIVVWIVALASLRYLFRRELAIQPQNIQALEELNADEVLTEPTTALRIQFVLGGAILFFLSEELLGLSPAFIGIAAATVALAWVQPDLKSVFEKIEWEVLLFFTALFVTVGGLEAAGVLQRLADVIGQVKFLPPVLIGIILLWLVAALSAIVDNIPITIALVPVIQALEGEGINTFPLWWALAFGAGFGGNGTIIGSTANVVVASLSDRTRTPITSAMWNRKGLPVMLATCATASILYLLAYPWLAK